MTDGHLDGELTAGHHVKGTVMVRAEPNILVGEKVGPGRRMSELHADPLQEGVHPVVDLGLRFRPRRK
jgi:hypothetical protein